MAGCTVQGNGGWGLELLDCGGRYQRNVVRRNGRGSVAVVRPEGDGLGGAELAAANDLDAPPRAGGS